MTTYVLTAVGEDREGLVSALSRTVESHGGNWLESCLAHLAGRFAGIVLVDLDADRLEEFRGAVSGLQDSHGWRVTVAELEGDTPVPALAQEEETPLWTVELLGQDRRGMVSEVSAAIADAGGTIESFDSWTSAAPEGGGTLFQAQAEVRLPAGADPAELAGALERIAAELMVDVHLVDGDR